MGCNGLARPQRRQGLLQTRSHCQGLEHRRISRAVVPALVGRLTALHGPLRASVYFFLQRRDLRADTFIVWIKGSQATPVPQGDDEFAAGGRVLGGCSLSGDEFIHAARGWQRAAAGKLQRSEGQDRGRLASPWSQRLRLVRRNFFRSSIVWSS